MFGIAKPGIRCLCRICSRRFESDATSSRNVVKSVTKDHSTRLPIPTGVPANRILLLNRLAFDLEEDEIKKAFEPIGGVENVTIARDSDTNKSRGYGYMIFKDPKLAHRSEVEMQGLVLHNFPIKVQVKSEARYRGLESKKYDILYVKNLPYDASDREVLQLFAPYEALRCGLAHAPITKKNLGYGFIRFSSPESAYRALQKSQGVSLHGRKLKVAFAQPKPNNYRHIV